MADEDTQDVSQTEDSAVDGGQTDGEVDVTKQSDADFMADTVKQIKKTQAAILDDDNEDVSDDDTGNDGGRLTELAGTNIPDIYSEAAEASGMTPSEIIAYADKHTDEELIEEASAIREKLKLLDEAEEDKDNKVTKQDDKKGDDVDNEAAAHEAELAERIAKQVEEKLGVSLKEIEDFKAAQMEQSNKQMVDTASKIFDEASKDFPIFGKTDELPRFPSGRLAGQLIPTSPAMKARLEVLKYADAFIGTGADIDNAMVNALATYKGLHLEKELERKQVRDLKQHETKLSGARVGKETKKKYADSRDEIIDEIRQMQRQAGID